jgi:UDP-xylose/UDP-N-acetylglucosamine transporter B4
MADDGKGESLLVPVSMVFGGCMCALICMEYVLKGDPKAGNLLSLCEVVFALLPAIPERLAGFRVQPLAAPLTSHVQFAVLWGSMAFLANYAFAYKISMTIFTMVRSCNLIGNVLLGRLFFGCRYGWMQLFCVCSVSVGIFLASIGEARTVSSPSASCSDCSDVPPAHSKLDAQGSSDSLGIWMIGISMLAVVQLLNALLGHLQSRFYKDYAHLASKNQLSDEYMFTSQVVALIPLMFIWDDLGAAISAALQSPPMPIIPIPSRIVWLLLNCMADYVCLTGVFRTSSIVPPLTLTMILSVRKFLSTVVSVLWFKNAWTNLHSLAVPLIFGGALIYSQAPQVEKEQSEEEAAKKSD